MSPAEQARLYVILGSHACRTAMLMLDHKGVSYRLLELPAGLHPAALRLLGFSGSRHVTRTIGGRRPIVVGIGERMGTVPALRVDGRRVQSNHAIARFLDELKPDPALFPADPAARRSAEEVERWGDEELQMTARRVALCATLTGRLRDGGQSGRLGPLLLRHRGTRRLAVELFSLGFLARPRAERSLLEQARAQLDRVDEWISKGALDGERPFAPDFVVAPSLALLDYHADLHEEISGRPAGRLVDRLLPA